MLLVHASLLMLLLMLLPMLLLMLLLMLMLMLLLLLLLLLRLTHRFQILHQPSFMSLAPTRMAVPATSKALGVPATSKAQADLMMVMAAAPTLAALGHALGEQSPRGLGAQSPRLQRLDVCCQHLRSEARFLIWEHKAVRASH